MGLPGQLHGRVPRQPRHVQPARPAALADDQRRLARYVEAISGPWRDRVRLRAPVRRIERLPDGVRIEAEGCESEDFDEVVIATHSDQALAMLADPSDAEREVLGAIPYQRNEAVLHTDASLMPRRRTRLGELELPPRRAAGGRTTVTYWMNNLQRLRAERDYLRHPQPRRADRPGQGDRSASATTHPVYTAEGVAAQARHAEISGVAAPTTAAPTGAGASTRTAVVSALRACERLLAPPPTRGRSRRRALAA